MGALVLRNAPYSNYAENVPVVDQWIHVLRATRTLPQSTARAEFVVSGGLVCVKAMVGIVTTALGAGTTPELRINANPATGTTTQIATYVNVASDEVGTLYYVEGDGTALVAVSSGYAQTANGNGFIVDVGDIESETDESIAGSIEWHLWYQPLEETARVTLE